MTNRKKQWQSYLYIILLNLILFIVLTGVTWGFHYFSLMDTHLLQIIKDTLTSKDFTVSLTIGTFFIGLCVSYILLIPFYFFFPHHYPVIGEILYTMIFGFVFLYLFPSFHLLLFDLSLYETVTTVHFFCFFFIYAIWLGETIRFIRFI